MNTPQKLYQKLYLFQIKPLSDLQSEVLISNLQYKLSDNFISPFLKQEISSIQKNNCIPTCIYINPNHTFTSSTNLFSIKLALSYNISFCTTYICNIPSPLLKEQYPFSH